VTLDPVLLDPRVDYFGIDGFTCPWILESMGRYISVSTDSGVGEPSAPRSVNMEIHRHGYSSTRGSINTELEIHQHRYLLTRISIDKRINQHRHPSTRDLSLRRFINRGPHRNVEPSMQGSFSRADCVLVSGLPWTPLYLNHTTELRIEMSAFLFLEKEH